MQFNVSLAHRDYFTKHLRDIYELQIIHGGTEWPLAKRHRFVENKLMIEPQTSETLNGTSPDKLPDKSAELCMFCGVSGHWAANCPQFRGKNGKGSKCYRCGQPGHWSSSCPSANRSPDDKPSAVSRDTPFPIRSKGNPSLSYGKSASGRGPPTTPPAKKGPISADEKQRRRDLNLCLYCGQPGHGFALCPNARSQTARKLHAHSRSSKGKGKPSVRFSKGKSSRLHEIQAEEDWVDVDNPESLSGLDWSEYPDDSTDTYFYDDNPDDGSVESAPLDETTAFDDDFGPP